jgi:peroxiredoxin
MLTVGERAPNPSFGRSDGPDATLDDLRRDGPVVLAFLRHFGWPFCREYLAALREGAQEIEDAGGHVVAVTQGDAQQAQALCARFDVPFPCLADPQRAGYKAFELKRGNAWEVMGPPVLAPGLRAASKGHFVERPVGDVMQLPGTFIIDREGIVRYARYARHAADHPSVGEIVAALRGLGRSAPA